MGGRRGREKGRAWREANMMRVCVCVREMGWDGPPAGLGLFGGWFGLPASSKAFLGERKRRLTD